MLDLEPRGTLELLVTPASRGVVVPPPAPEKVFVETGKSLEGGIWCCGFCRLPSMPDLTRSFVALSVGLILITELFIFSS